MSLTFLEETFLRGKGATDADIALINQELPDIENLIAVTRSHLDQINRVLRLLEIVQRLVHNARSQ